MKTPLISLEGEAFGMYRYYINIKEADFCIENNNNIKTSRHKKIAFEFRYAYGCLNHTSPQMAQSCKQIVLLLAQTAESALRVVVITCIRLVITAPNAHTIPQRWLGSSKKLNGLFKEQKYLITVWTTCICYKNMYFINVSWTKARIL